MGDIPQVGPTALLHCNRDAVAFLVMLVTCSLKLSLLSSVTPRNFTEVDKSTVALPTTIGLRVHFLFHVNITTDGEIFCLAPVHDCVNGFAGTIPDHLQIVAFC